VVVASTRQCARSHFCASDQLKTLFCDGHHIGRGRDLKLSTTPVKSRGYQGEMIMAATITFVIFAVAIALPGLITVLLGATVGDVAEFRAPQVTEYGSPTPA
jgi:hypothetical protein